MFAAEEFAISYLGLCVCVLLCSDCFTRKANVYGATRGQIFSKRWFCTLFKCKDQSCYWMWFIQWVGKLSAAGGFIPNSKKLQCCRNFSLLGCVRKVFALFDKQPKSRIQISGFSRNLIIHGVTVKFAACWWGQIWNENKHFPLFVNS